MFKNIFITVYRLLLNMWDIFEKWILDIMTMKKVHIRIRPISLN